MLGLKLRDEFLEQQMRGTAIALRTNDNQGAAQKAPEQILSITFPTSDVQVALSAISQNRSGLPIVLVGDRGRGKSHIMAVMHHAIMSPDIVQDWMKNWGKKLGSSKLESAQIEHGYMAITEAVHNNEYSFLWDLLFDRHPNGQYFRGQFDDSGLSAPSRTLIEKMLQKQPVCLILDEFQTWYTGLPETDKTGNFKIRQSAFSFIQMLSEIAKDRPELLILVVSTLDTSNEAYQQIHRVGEVIISFHGASAKKDRQNLILHRLFENRANIQDSEIKKISNAYAVERSRLLFSDRTGPEQNEIQNDVSACWPFSPELLELLEDHILMSSEAQNTRDLIRILAQAFKSNGDNVPVITPADFHIDGTHDAAHELVNSIASGEKLLEIAQRNLQAVRNAGISTQYDCDIISAIWMYSMVMGLTPGIAAPKLQLVITRDSPVDDNIFQADLGRIIENSINIHGDETAGQLLRFEFNENPRSKVRAYARNEKLWLGGNGSSSTQTQYPHKDIEHIRKTLKAIFTPENHSSQSKVIVLGPDWLNNPWDEVDDADKPDKWDRPVLLVIPEKFSADKSEINKTLGVWLKNNVSKRRNTIRFLLSQPYLENIFQDKKLKFYARCSYLCSKNAWGQSADRTYSSLWNEFDRPLRNILKDRYNRFAIIREWDFQDPEKCIFDIEKITAQGGDIPKKVDEKIAIDLFDQTEFANLVADYAKKGKTTGSLMDELLEPAPPGKGNAIPYLGEFSIYEQIIRLAAQGRIALNVNGEWFTGGTGDATVDDALKNLRSKAFRSQQENRQVQINLPGAVGGSDVTTPTKPADSQHDKKDTAESAGTDNDNKNIEEPKPENPYPGVSTPQQDDPVPPSQPEPDIHTEQTDNPLTGINLSGQFEKWGIDNSQELDNAQLEFKGLSVQQIKQILTKIPSAYKARLSVKYKK